MTLVVGSGHLGSILAADLKATLWPCLMQEIRAPDLRDVSHLICAAGKTDLAWCEANPLEAWEHNTSAPLHLARLALGVGTRYIHLGSACLWEGPFRPMGHPFAPDTPPDPPSWYGWTKAACDSFLLGISKTRVAVLRPRQPFSTLKHPRNTLTKLLGYEALIDTPNSMTSAGTIVKTAQHLVSSVDSPLWGRASLVYDLGISSPYKVGQMLHEAGLRAAPKPLEKSALDTWHKPKRVDVVCDDPIFERAILPSWVDGALREAIAGYPR